MSDEDRYGRYIKRAISERALITILIVDFVIAFFIFVSTESVFYTLLFAAYCRIMYTFDCHKNRQFEILNKLEQLTEKNNKD